MTWGTCAGYVTTVMEEVKDILQASAKTHLKEIAGNSMITIGYSPHIADKCVMIMPGEIDWSRTRDLQKRVQVKLAVQSNMLIGSVDEYQSDIMTDMVGEVIDELTSDANGTTTSGWFVKDKLICNPRVTIQGMMMYEITINYYWGP